MELIRATERELDELLAFYQLVADDMEDKGLCHWHWGRYPNEQMIREDVEKGDMYFLRDNGQIGAAVVLTVGQESEFDSLNWSFGIRPGSFRRLAVHPSLQGKGLGGLVLDDVQQILRRSGCDCVRCDTLDENFHAIRLYQKLGFRRCGTIHWPDNIGDNITFDKPLKRETTLWPIPMKPAFRCGTATPWGGTGLRENYGKETMDDRTGESLEVSCIPGLESRDADDDYAAAHENGKLGKTEAWLILDTPPEGAEIVYGVRQGTTLQALREAAQAGSALEPLLNRVKVSRGDVFYIPAGCIHALGAGIMLYEIQQSSDLTYRFYDWDRRDANGNRRELHLDKALDVADLRCVPVPVRVEKAFGVKRVLSEPYFTLDMIRTDTMECLPPINGFGILTVTEGELELRFSGGYIRMKAGETCLLPNYAPVMALVGVGAAALAMPN